MPGSPLLATLRRNIRHALRTLRSGRTWTVAAVLSLALGIGSSTALFSVFHNYALKSLPVSEPRELVTLRWSGEPTGRRASHHYAHLTGADGTRGGHTFPFDVVEQLRAAGRSLSGLLAFAPSGPLNAFADGSAEFASGQFVSGNFHALLGVDAVAGRTLMPRDDDESADPVVVISHQYRVRRFGMDESPVGEPVTINGMTFTVVGVTPPDFGDLLPRGLPDAPDLTIPLGLEPRLRGPRSLLRSRSTWWLAVMGRMKPEVRAETVEAELRVAFRQAMRASDPSAASSPSVEPRLHVVSGRHGLSDPSADTLRRLATAAVMLGLLLSVACINAAGLFFSRNAMRQREIAVRAALGASRGRLTAQLLAESMLLAGLGCAVGLLAAHWLAAWAGTASPLPAGVTIVSAPALAFAAVLTVAAAVLAGAGSAIHATRAVSVPLAGRGFGTSPSSHPWRNRSLIAVQVALTVFLLAAAGLFLRTFSNLQQVDLGFDPDNVVSFTVDPGSSGYDRPRVASLYRRLDDRLSSVPGVRSVSSSALGGTLLDGGGVRIAVELDGRTDRPEASLFSVEHDFFDTLRIPLVLGRLFTRDDTSESPVALVNQTFAREFFPAGSPLGRRFRGGRNVVEVVGVVGDARVDSLRFPAPPTFYVPTTQLALPARTVLVRTAAAPGGAVPAIRAAVREVDPQIPLGNIGPLVDRIGANHLGSERVMAFASGLFGVLALLTALAGLFGLTTCNVVRRTKEIGIRMALGTTRGAVLRSVMSETLVVVGCGLFVGGGAAAVTLGRLVESQLFGLVGHDPATLLLTAAVTLSACMLAGFFPARRAARVDPMTVMRRD